MLHWAAMWYISRLKTLALASKSGYMDASSVEYTMTLPDSLSHMYPGVFMISLHGWRQEPEQVPQVQTARGRPIATVHRDGQRGQERGGPEQDVVVEHPLADMEMPKGDHVFKAFVKPSRVKIFGLTRVEVGKHQFLKST